MLYSIFMFVFAVNPYFSTCYEIVKMFRNVSKKQERNFLFACFENISYLCTEFRKILNPKH